MTEKLKCGKIFLELDVVSDKEIADKSMELYDILEQNGFKIQALHYADYKDVISEYCGIRWLE